MLRYGLSRDFVKDRSNMASDVSLQVRGQTVVEFCPRECFA
jgi:hypothetical protein